MTTAASAQIVPREPASLPALRAAEQSVASALESVLSDNTRRVYGVQWRLFTDWCGEMGLHSLPANPLTVARYLAVRAGSGALAADVMAVIRLTASSPAFAAVASRPPRRPPSAPASTWSWWPCYRTGG